MLLSKRSPASALPLTAATLWNAAGLKSLQAWKILLLCPRRLQYSLTEISSDHHGLCPSKAAQEYVPTSERAVLLLWEPSSSWQPCTLHGLHLVGRCGSRVRSFELLLTVFPKHSPASLAPCCHIQQKNHNMTELTGKAFSSLTKPSHPACPHRSLFSSLTTFSH